MDSVLQVGLIIAALGLRFRSIDGRASPDCQYYLNMAVGRPVPAPYCRRVLVPWLTRTLLLVLPFKPLNIMRVIVTFGIVAALGAAYTLTLSLGGTPWMATATVLILIGTDSLIGAWIMFPWLADPWAFAFACMAAASGPLPAAALLALAAVSKESAWALGSAFLILTGSPWWVAAPGLVLLGLLQFIRGAPPDTDWLQRPFFYAQAAKRREWFDYKKSLSSMKLTPWVVLWTVPGTLGAPVALVLAGIAWAQTLIAVDHSRLIAVCLFWIVPLAVSACPDNLLAVWVLAQIFWPLETEWV